MKYKGINLKSINAYVLGEHGNSQFVLWNIANQKISEFLSLDEKTRVAAYEVGKRKGFTYYGIVMALVRITRAILMDEDAVLPVSNYDSVNDVYISRTCVIGRNGVKRNVFMELSKDEKEKLQGQLILLKEQLIV